MITRKNLSQNIIFLFITLGILSCGNRPAIQDYPASASPTDELAKLVKDINLAKTEQVDVLSPGNFENATKYQNNAENKLENQKSSKDVLHEVAKSRAYLNRAYQSTTPSKQNMSEIIQARDQAILSKANDYFKDDFKKLDKRFKDATSEIEDNDVKSALEKKGTLQLDYLDLELKSIKYTNLDESKQIIDKAIKEGAEEYAPQSLAVANRRLQQTDSFITANRHDSYEISTQSTKTMAAANHLLSITRSSKKRSRTSSEETALQMDRQKNTVTNQNLKLSQGKQKLIDEQEKARKGEQSIVALKSKNKSLNREMDFNQQYENARKQFKKEEAEVYKKGNTLVIRLHGLKFPVAQSGLTGENFQLLSKVQKVIQDLDRIQSLLKVIPILWEVSLLMKNSPVTELKQSKSIC